MSNRNFVNLSMGSGRYFDRINAFFALAEAGKSMQAKYAREAMVGLQEWEKDFDPNCQYTYDHINAVLADAYQRCGRECCLAPYQDLNGLCYGWDISIRRLNGKGWSCIPNPSVYEFLWVSYKHSLGHGKPGPTRYVKVRLDLQILSIEGKPSDVMELAMRAKLFEILPDLGVVWAKILIWHSLQKDELCKSARSPASSR